LVELLSKRNGTQKWRADNCSPHKTSADDFCRREAKAWVILELGKEQEVQQNCSASFKRRFLAAELW
jgi:hypothetical protein